MGTGGRPHITFRNVSVEYNKYVTALRNISFQVQPGEFVFLVGRTGSGKSTILKLLSRELKATQGQVQFESQDLGDLRESEVPAHRRRLGIVPQDFGLLPRKKAWENISYAMRAVGKTRKEVRKTVGSILESVNIAQRADAFPHEMSGGEQQRLAIARALINDPMLILADEPTGNLDPEHSLEILDLLLELNRKGATVLVATHDMLVLEKYPARRITLDRGQIMSDEVPRV